MSRRRPTATRTGRWRDHFTDKAKAEGYAARSIYKLKEIDTRLKLMLPGSRVLDLGASPGSWSRYALERVGDQGLVVAVDLKPLDFAHPRLRAHQGDAFELDPCALLPEQCAHFDVILSDMAPSTTGSRTADALRSAALCERVLECAQLAGAGGSHLIMKLLEGQGSQELLRALRDSCTGVRTFRPKATRKTSTEVFLYGQLRRSTATDTV